VSLPRHWLVGVAVAFTAGCAAAQVSANDTRCAAMQSDTVSTAPVDRRAQRLSIVFPAFTHGRPSGEVMVHSFVNRRGRVDSVRMVGTVSESFHLEIRRAAEASRFRPAERDGCPVAAWTDSMVMTFP
jgi:hypothetical protein